MANQFISLRKKSDNPHGSNLTELLAAESVDRGFMQHTDWMAHVSRYMMEMELVTRLKARTVLDVGCGALQLPYFFYRNRLPAIDAYWGLDLRAQDKWLAKYEWKTPATLVQLDLLQDDPTQLEGWPEGGFDLVSCTEVLEHVPKSEANILLAKLFYWTKTGGTCILSTPNRHPADFSSVADNHVGPDGVIREWWHEDLAHAIEANGFEIKERSGTFMKTKRIPKNSVHATTVDVLKRRLPYGLYSLVTAALFPAEATNIIWTLKKG